MQPIIKEKLNSLTDLCRRYDVKTMYVFGSACTEDFDSQSDVDILISFQEISVEQYTDNYFNLHDALEELLGRKVDLLTEKSLSNPYFIKSVEETKQLLYARVSTQSLLYHPLRDILTSRRHIVHYNHSYPLCASFHLPIPHF